MRIFHKYAVLCSTIILCGLLLVFFHNLSSKFQKTERDYKEHRAINLSSQTSKTDLSDLLYNNGYVANERDAAYIADSLVNRMKRFKYPTLYHLQKRDYGKVPMLVADSAGVLTEKVNHSNELVGLNDSLPSLNTLSSTLDNNNGDGELKVIIKSNNNGNLGDVFVRVEEHYLDADSVKSAVIGYAKTDSNGISQIKGLDRNKGYSVLPIKRGYEYGSAKGIVYGHFDKYKYFNKFWEIEYVFEFDQVEHRIQMIDNYTLKQIKDDGALTVRTPKEYKTIVIRWFVMVLLGWWILCFVLIRRKKNFDPLMIATAMFLTGLCVLIMFSIQNPLTEELRGVEMATGVLMGLACVIALQYVDFIKLYQNKYKWQFDIVMDTIKWLFLPFKRKVAWLAPVLSDSNSWWKKLGALILLLLSIPFGFLNVLQVDKLSARVEKLCKNTPKGFGWLLLAIVLTLLLWTPLGQSIGGMKVNLRVAGFTFQPSEIAKYLIIFFIAAFFVQNADTIISYSRPTSKKMINNLKNKMKTLSFVIVGLIVLMGIYAFILGDMGPALVIGVTFVLLYSLVKSKVNLDNLSDDNKWQRIFTCDFAMLIYGVISFAAFVVLGGMIGDSLTGAMLWFVGWIIYGVARHKQFFETAFIMNLLVFAFIFGGQVMQNIPGLKETDTAARFEQRTRMCVNTWGNLNLENKADSAEAVSNTQVANGLWALATGGMTGQGLGEGNPNLIPAFHTDMILSSIGEQMGWIGLVLVALALAFLLRRMIVIGYRVGHPFAFYFCSGVAIVTGVQFFIIALGSSGMIPLTGITVPFLSYGRVSMILNLIAFGIVLSLSQNIVEAKTEIVKEKVQQRSVGDYNYPVSIATWTFIVLALFTLGVWQYYCLWNRGKTLVHPAFVYSKEGAPMIEYNPRIALLTKEMWAGNIYDRNGLLLATSNKDILNDKDVISKLVDSCGLSKEKIASLTKAHVKRFYPFGEHLFFMLGDINNGLYFNSPIGYMAESRHLSYLRGYDNVMRDKDGNPAVVYLKNRTKDGNRFVKGCEHNDSTRSVVRDNSELIKYLKDGLNGSELEKHNMEVQSTKLDLYLTLDAKLQTAIQNNIEKYVQKGFNSSGDSSNFRRKRLDQNKHLRISVVVLDAENGDLLTSANYPLANCDTLKVKEEDARKMGEKYAVYNDNSQKDNWTAYTDMDLGLAYPTPPGSTAKVMSAMAGLNKLGTATGSNTKFDIQLYEVIDYNDKGEPVEPPMYGKTHEWVDMKQAIVVSSNCYFINLVNKYDLYNELKTIYYDVGIRLDRKSSYTLFYSSKEVQNINSIINLARSNALSSWDNYQNKKSKGLFVNGRHKKTLRKGEWMWAWGQNMDATPLAMTRVVSAVVNKGDMPETRYTMTDEVKHHHLTSSNNAMAIKGFMREQYEYNSINKNHLSKYETLGGKTGTPQRPYTAYRHKEGQNKNDGWYVFYVDNKSVDKSKHNIAVAVRMERIGLNGGSSTDAMWLSREVVIPMLQQYNYIIEGTKN